MIKHAPFLYTTELESMAGLCFRAFDGANYEARYSVAKLLGTLVASTQAQTNHPQLVSGDLFTLTFTDAGPKESSQFGPYHSSKIVFTRVSHILEINTLGIWKGLCLKHLGV